ncbi:MAG: hypothetical protein GWN84_16325 [Gammaproteobacteria bacterium]|nr:hypothetical protein [Gammaproteobacteria bacterium]NIR84355.1 hypothetical protein [Gammaproteobacteria bacterium]NIR89871.1 hypothetical protein [Gammaproteobacteria bacterium]NIU05738.1 hypothetical protein [Gammaproteobacteria bacterium]NIV52498.1 hypothetical protein [Gammaproteobacteria bacterium]
MSKAKPDPIHHRIRHLVSRFPDREEIIRKLHVTNVNFEALCDRYHQVSEEIEGLHRQGGAAVEDIDALKHRRAALEEELMGMMSAGTRI